MPVTKTETIGVQVVNGWNNMVHDTGGVTVGFTSALTEPKYALDLNVYTGPEKIRPARTLIATWWMPRCC